MKKIDTRGLSCPQPVIMVLDEIKSENTNLEIIIDTEVVKENVSRLLRKFKINFEIIEKDDEIFIKTN